MNQLLIVNSAKALNGKRDNDGATVTPLNLSNLDEGAITFFQIGDSSALAAAPTKNFGIALGRAAGLPPFVIPEVDIDTLEITKALPKAEVMFSASFTMPTPVVGKEYTVILIKKGTVPGERNMFSTSIVAGSTTAATEAAALVAAINNKTSDLFSVTASNASAVITITDTTGGDWTVKLADSLFGVTLSTNVAHEKAIGDKKFIQELARKCAAGKGFVYLDGESMDINPGYPEAVENLVPNTSGASGASTAGYALFTLRFATGRKAGKTTDERVWQNVFIACPITAGTSGATYNSISTILPEGKFSPNQVAAKAAADAVAAAGE